MDVRKMSTRVLVAVFLFGVIYGLGSVDASAEDLMGAEVILCTSSLVHQCTASSGCEQGPPWKYNIPHFVEVDFQKKELRTTEASRLNRSSPIRNMDLEDGFHYLQGVEDGRAFSLVISEDDGLATYTIAADGMSITAFGACTPISNKS